MADVWCPRVALGARNWHYERASIGRHPLDGVGGVLPVRCPAPRLLTPRQTSAGRAGHIEPSSSCLRSSRLAATASRTRLVANDAANFMTARTSRWAVFVRRVRPPRSSN